MIQQQIMSLPFVSIIIVNYNGKHLLSECLSSLSKLEYPKSRFEVIVVDNNSDDDSVPFIKTHYKQVKLIESHTNGGFTGGNNLGYQHAKGEYIVLLNSDVTVDREWLSALVRAAADKDVGIVSSRLRYFTPFVEVKVKSLAIPKSQLNSSIDHSPVGVLVEDVLCQDKNVTPQVFYKSGFYPRQVGEVATRRMSGDAVINLPYPLTKDSFSYTFTIHGFESKEIPEIPIEISLAGKVLLSAKMYPNEVKQLTLTLHKKDIVRQLRWYIQNAGNILLHNGYSKDRGSVLDVRDNELREFYEEENKYYLKPATLLAACGAGCLIKRAVIDHVGFLDGHYFMYYEDVEFSLRAWRAGWKIVYEPNAIGYHRHRATTGASESAFFIQQTEKNHLAFVISHFPKRIVLQELFFFLMRFGITTVKAFVFQFRDNIERTRIWHRKFEGRRAAFKYVMASFLRLLSSRRHLNRYWPIDRKTMASMVY